MQVPKYVSLESQMGGSIIGNVHNENGRRRRNMGGKNDTREENMYKVGEKGS